MKNKSLFVYLLIAIAVYVLQHPTGCSGNQSKEQSVIYVPRIDTIVRYVTGETVTRIITRVDTVKDRVDINHFEPVDTPVLILFTDREESGDVRLFEGIGKGQDGQCEYKYLLGIHQDSLQFLIVETECKQQIKNIIIENPLGTVKYGQIGTEPFMLGAKMGMTLDKQYKTFGLQAAYRGLYASVDYVPAIKKPVLEAGVLFALGKRSKDILNTSDTLTIKYE